MENTNIVNKGKLVLSINIMKFGNLGFMILLIHIMVILMTRCNVKLSELSHEILHFDYKSKIGIFIILSVNIAMIIYLDGKLSLLS